MSRAAAAALALLTAGTLLLRTGILHSGYWIDEAITVGIALIGLGYSLWREQRTPRPLPGVLSSQLDPASTT